VDQAETATVGPPSSLCCSRGQRRRCVRRRRYVLLLPLLVVACLYSWRTLFVSGASNHRYSELPPLPPPTHSAERPTTQRQTPQTYAASCGTSLNRTSAACHARLSVVPAVANATLLHTCGSRKGAAVRIHSGFSVRGLAKRHAVWIAPQVQQLRTSIVAAAMPGAGHQQRRHQHVDVTGMVAAIEISGLNGSTDGNEEPWSTRVQDEAYTLEVRPPTHRSGVAHVEVQACSLQGVRHALRTLAALVQPAASLAAATQSGTFDGSWRAELRNKPPTVAALLPTVRIVDQPRFSYRGFLLDSAHHFVPPQQLRRLITLLGRMKYNALHWHATDTQGFQLELPSHPELARASTSPGERYSSAEIIALVRFARQHGVSLVAELEMPGHAASWRGAYPSLTAVGPQAHQAAASPSGAAYASCPEGKGNLDVTNSTLFPVIDALLADLATLFPAAALHLGGEETYWGCWLGPKLLDRARRSIFSSSGQPPKRNSHWSNDAPHMLYEYFLRQVHGKLLQQSGRTQANEALQGRRVIVWEDVLFEAPEWTARELSRQRTIIEVFKRPRWDRMSVYNATLLGFDVLVTNVDSWYLDFQNQWEVRYRFEPLVENLRWPNDPHKLTVIPEAGMQASHVLGGEGGCWGKCTADLERNILDMARSGGKSAAVDGLLAIAERLWVGREVTNLDCARSRLLDARRLLSHASSLHDEPESTFDKIKI
jgi:hypothetical protein